jgi:hypothetical protein
MGGTRAEKEVYFEKLKALVETYREWIFVYYPYIYTYIPYSMSGHVFSADALKSPPRFARS